MLRIRQDGTDSGDHLMATDYDLLQLAAAEQSDPVLRFYQWNVPTISLGFHQSDTVLDHERLNVDQTPWTRRPTGGAAVLHSDELTYAIVISSPDPGAGKRLQQYVSVAIAEGLRSLGVPADVDERGEPLSALPNRTSCFVRTSRWEVTAGGRKLVGSAQRKLGTAYLQHGSILVGDDHLRIVDYLAMANAQARETLRERLRQRATSISTELDRRVSLDNLRTCLADSFRERLPLLFESAGISATA